LFAVLFVTATRFAIFGFWQKVEAEAKNRELGSLLEEAAWSDRLVAKERLVRGEDNEALAYLVRASRYVPKSSSPASVVMIAEGYATAVTLAKQGKVAT
jgi:hypothetical protein